MPHTKDDFLNRKLFLSPSRFTPSQNPPRFANTDKMNFRSGAMRCYVRRRFRRNATAPQRECAIARARPHYISHEIAKPCRRFLTPCFITGCKSFLSPCRAFAASARLQMQRCAQPEGKIFKLVLEMSLFRPRSKAVFKTEAHP